jgi:hypothetical protein
MVRAPSTNHSRLPLHQQPDSTSHHFSKALVFFSRPVAATIVEIRSPLCRPCVTFVTLEAERHKNETVGNAKFNLVFPFVTVNLAVIGIFAHESRCYASDQSKMIYIDC